jgi:hypothetical protein
MDEGCLEVWDAFVKYCKTVMEVFGTPRTFQTRVIAF